jgi:TrmH family RNA methyltransferase
MLSKAQIKYIQSLHNKKLRHTERVYVIEGEKIIHEYIQSNYPLGNIYATTGWTEENRDLLQKKNLGCIVISQKELDQISSLTTPNKVVALAEMGAIPTPKVMESLLATGLHLALDSIQDPGNFGTIIRTADWFGVESILCSTDCVDAYNSKVVQATMGSLARVKINYTDLEAVLQKTSLPVYAAVLEGDNIFNQKLPMNAIVLVGNESKGISEPLKGMSTKKISIPRFGKAESLNASVAAAVVLALFRKG